MFISTFLAIHLKLASTALSLVSMPVLLRDLNRAEVMAMQFPCTTMWYLGKSLYMYEHHDDVLVTVWRLLGYSTVGYRDVNGFEIPNIQS